jgi:hypothetical protein
VFRRRQQAFAALFLPAFLEGNIESLCAGEHVTYIRRRIDPFLSRSALSTRRFGRIPILTIVLQAEATASDRNLLVLFGALHPSAGRPSSRPPKHSSASLYLGDARRNADINTPASVRRRSSSGPSARGQRAPVFRIVPVGSIVNKHVDGVRPLQTPTYPI